MSLKLLLLEEIRELNGGIYCVSVISVRVPRLIRGPEGGCPSLTEIDWPLQA